MTEAEKEICPWCGEKDDLIRTIFGPAICPKCFSGEIKDEE